MKEWIMMLMLLLIIPTVQSVYIDGNNTIGNETLTYNETENVTLECKWVEGELLCGIPSFVSYIDIGETVIVEPEEPSVNLTFTKSDIERFYTAENSTNEMVYDIMLTLIQHYDMMKRNRETFEIYMNQTDKQLKLFNDTVHTVIYVTNESTMKAMQEAEKSRGQGIWQGVGTVIGVISVVGGTVVVTWIKYWRWNF